MRPRRIAHFVNSYFFSTTRLPGELLMMRKVTDSRFKWNRVSADYTPSGVDGGAGFRVQLPQG